MLDKSRGLPLETERVEKTVSTYEEFRRICDPDHPVRNHLESVEDVRTIREAFKK